VSRVELKMLLDRMNEDLEEVVKTLKVLDHMN